MNKKLVLLGNMFNHLDLFLKLFSFLSLRKGWNSYYAEPISNKVIYKAAYIMSEILSNEMEVFPTGYESIQIEWGDMEIEINDKYDDDKGNYGINGFMEFQN